MSSVEGIRRRTGAAARASVIRPGRVWRIPWGIGRGLRLIVEHGAPLHRYIGTSEIELSRFIRRFARPGAICFDVGAYDGYVALIMARLTGAPVWCFDYDPERVSRIHNNLVLNPSLAPLVHVEETYVAHETRDSPRTDTIDDLIARLGVAPDLLMIDVEGAEAPVLSGSSRLLREKPPNLIIETHSTRSSAECLALIDSAGYRPRTVPRRRLLRENRGTGHNEWIVALSPHR